MQTNPMFDATSDAADDAPTGKYTFIRHGEAEHNVLFRKGQSEKGVEILDPPLTGKGRRQVEALRKYIREEGLTFDVVYCSCLTRALQTCQIIFEDIQPSRVVVTPLQTETGVDVPGDDRVGGPCRSGRPLEELQQEFPPGWDWSGLEDSASWARKNSTSKKDGAVGWAHPLPKEKRLDEFRILVDRRPAERVAIVGHAAVFKSLVGIKMTSCQMLWTDELRDSDGDD